MSTYLHCNRPSHLCKNLSKQYRITHGQPFDDHRLKDHHSTNATQFISSFDASNLSSINLRRSYKEHFIALPSNIDSRLEHKSSLSSNDLGHEFQLQLKKLYRHPTFRRPLPVANRNKNNQHKKKDRFRTSEFVHRLSDSLVKSNLTTNTDQNGKRPINSKRELFRTYDHFESSITDIDDDSWRKLRANLTRFHRDSIQQFQRERQHMVNSVGRPIMISPLIKRTEDSHTDVNNVKLCINESSAFSKSTSSDLLTEYLLTSNLSNRTLESAGIRSTINSENENFSPDQNDHSIVSIAEQKIFDNQKGPSADNNGTTEKYDRNILNDYRFSNDFNIVESILYPKSLVVPTRTNNADSSVHQWIKSTIPVQHDDIHSEQLSDEYLMDRSQFVSQPNTLTTNKFLFIPSILNSCNSFKTLTSAHKPMMDETSSVFSELTTDSLTRSIQEISLLIRQLLQLNIDEKHKLTLQTTITTQLCILLTYFTQSDNRQIFNQVPQKMMIHAMTSTRDDQDVISNIIDTVEIPTNNDFEHSKMQIDTSNSQSPILENVNPIDSFSDNFDPSQNSENLESDSSAVNLEVFRDLAPRLLSTAQLSQSELLSNSVPLRRYPHESFRFYSDTCIGSIHQRQEMLSSSYRLISMSEPNLSPWLQFHCSKFSKHSKLIQQKFSCFVELESSNTYLEASTEFTPDFFLSTMNNSKCDEERTEQFGIDVYHQTTRSNVIPSISDEQEEAKPSLVSNSQNEQHQNSLDLLVEEGNDDNCFTDDYQSKITLESIENISLPNSKLFDLQLSTRSNNDRNFFSTHSENDNPPILIDDQICQLYSFSQIEYNSFDRQYQSPIYSINMNNKIISHEKRNAQIRLQRRRIQSSISHRVAMIGKRVRIKSNCRSISKESSQDRNNNYDIGSSTVSRESLSTEMNTDMFQKDPTKSNKNLLLEKKSHIMVFETNQNNSLALREINDKFDQNISLAQRILQMFNETTNQIESNVKQTELLHFHIRQFLLDFNRRVLLNRKMKYKSKNKHHMYYQVQQSSQFQSKND